MTPEMLIQEILTQTNVHVFSIALKFLLVGFGAFLIKLLVESLCNYFLFRYNKYVGIDTKIEIFGKIGIVKSISYTSLILETDEGDFHIPISAWKTAQYTVLKDKE